MSGVRVTASKHRLMPQSKAWSQPKTEAIKIIVLDQRAPAVDYTSTVLAQLTASSISTRPARGFGLLFLCLFLQLPSSQSLPVRSTLALLSLAQRKGIMAALCIMNTPQGLRCDKTCVGLARPASILPIVLFQEHRLLGKRLDCPHVVMSFTLSLSQNIFSQRTNSTETQKTPEDRPPNTALSFFSAMSCSAASLSSCFSSIACSVRCREGGKPVTFVCWFCCCRDYSTSTTPPASVIIVMCRLCSDPKNTASV